MVGGNQELSCKNNTMEHIFEISRKYRLEYRYQREISSIDKKSGTVNAPLYINAFYLYRGGMLC